MPEIFLTPATAGEMIRKKEYSALRRILSTVPAADIAEFMEESDTELLPFLFRILPKETAAEVFVDMDPDLQELLITAFSDYELKQILDELYLDDTVDLIEEMPANVVSRILRNSTTEARKSINELLKYPDDSAGSIMTTEYVNLKPDMTVGEAFELIRKVAIDKETIYTCYVTSGRKLIGIVSAKALMLAPLYTQLSEIMECNVVSVSTLTDKEEVGILFGKYGLLALPVVDAENRMVGIITVDDAIDVIQEEAEEDFTVMAAITPSETSYLKTSVFSLFFSRIPWLMLLLISSAFSGMIISTFEASLSACVILTAFIPMLMGTGGNCGSQASVTVIRGLSLGEIEYRDVPRVVWKEARVSVLCAISLAVLSYIKILVVDYWMMQSLSPTEISSVPLVVALAMAVTVICSKLIGCSLPILAKKLGFDPAVMASPFITTLVDTISLIVYFLIAVQMIPALQI